MIEAINVRFFIYKFDENLDDYDVMEVDETEFMEHPGKIDYERNTVFENGCRQVCLTKGLPQC